MSTASATIVVRPDDLRTTNQQLAATVEDMRTALRRLDDRFHGTTLNRADPELDTAGFTIDTALARNRLWSTAEHLEADAEFLTTCATDAEAADRCLPRTEGPIATGLTVYSGLDAVNTMFKAKPVVDLAVLTGRWTGNRSRAGMLAGPAEQAVPGAYRAWRAEYLTAGYRGVKIAEQTADLKQAIGDAPTAIGHLDNRYPKVTQLRPVARIGASPALRTAAKFGGYTLGGLSIAFDGRTAYRSFEAGDVETGVVYALRTFGGAAMLLSPFPPLAVAGAVIVAGTLAYEYRDHIIDGAQYLLDKHDRMVAAGRTAVGNAASAVADTIDDAVTGLIRFGW
jgi:hypothetical protein